MNARVTMWKPLLLMALALVLVLGGVIGYKLNKQAKLRAQLAGMESPATYLHAARAQAQTWQPRLSAIGSLRAQQGIEIRNEVEGVIRALHIQPGQAVKAGDLLVALDDTVERATFKSASVRLEQARRDFERDRALFERKLIAEDAFELSRSEFEAAQALVEETQGIIDKKTLRAPFGGYVGIHQLAVGHYLEQGAEIVTLQALDQLYLEFQVPENHLSKLRPEQRVEFSVPTFRDRVFHGVINSINVKVHATTRNVLVQAIVDNAERALLPGMFADISVVLDEDHPVIALPRGAVAFTLYGESVYLLEPEGDLWRIKSQRVTTGMTQGNKVAVDGIPAGAWVAADSQNKLMNGDMAMVVNHAELNALSEGASAERP